MNKSIKIAVVMIIGFGIGIGWSVLSHSNRSINLAKTPVETVSKIDIPDSFRSILDQSITEYFKMQQALSQDALSTTKQAASQLSVHLSQAVNVDAEIKAIWTSETPPIQTALGIIQDAPTLTEARKAFETLSHHIETLVIHYGGPKTYHINKYYCPMVDGDRGAYWLQHTSGTQNPYFGSQMFRCGGVVKTLQ